MAVYIGDNKNTSAATTALQINYAVSHIVDVAIKERYPDTGFQVRQSVGIDTSDLFVARTGIRGSNDLVWVGRAANYAAKLCSLREGTYVSYITEDVFNALGETAKYGGELRQVMWEKSMWQDEGIAVYRSSWTWRPS
jgi:class 3 adenylate cyclase